MEAKLNKLVIPGYTFTPTAPPRNVIIIGPGLKRDNGTNDLLVTKCGILKHKHPNVYWVDGAQNKYIPKRGDLVIGTITRKLADSFKVDIGAAEQATVPLNAFEWVSRMQKPDIRTGETVFARVLSAHKQMEPDLVCVDKAFKGNNLGKLPANGIIFRVPISTVYLLLSHENELLQTFGKKHVFEAAIGLNGRIWVNGLAPNKVTKFVNCLRTIHNQTPKSINDVCRKHK